MRERVLTRRELNRALLGRQLLLRREGLPVGRALERVAGLQAQDARAPYLGLWARLESFRREDLTRALLRKRAVKATLMRGTLHLVAVRDYLRFAPAVAPMVQALWQRYLRDREEVGDVETLAAHAAAYASEPRTNAEMIALLGEDAWWRIRRHVAFVHVPGDEEWAFAQRPRFATAEAWLGRQFPSQEDDLPHLVRRYFRAFGPAAAEDIAAWSGLTAAALRPALERLRLRRFRDERGRVLFDVPGAPLPDESTPAPVRLLPPFDNLILSHADRTRVISDEHRRAVISGGLVDPVVLVDGFVAGRWRLDKGQVLLEPLDGRLSDEVREEADRLVSWLGESASRRPARSGAQPRRAGRSARAR